MYQWDAAAVLSGPGDEIAVNVSSLDRMTRFFSQTGIRYRVGKVWTTDGIYRETRDKVARRKAEGCICVEMECAAIAALARFRNRSVSQFFYSADNLDNDVWEMRSLANESQRDVKHVIMDRLKSSARSGEDTGFGGCTGKGTVIGTAVVS